MSGLALIFPGQGAQFVGMGQELIQAFPSARAVLELADRELGYSISRLMAEGPEEQLKQTEHTQPAIVTHSLAALAVLQERGVKPQMVAGHSVGEYAALAASGAVSSADAIRLVRQRGLFMQGAGPGAMAALLGADLETAERLCAVCGVEVANLNSPGQVVISGSVEGIAEAVKRASELGVKKAVPLAVSGAFHSSLMQPAASRLAEELERQPLRDAAVPLVANRSARPLIAAEELRTALKEQIVSRVLWEDSVRTMLASGIDTFVEVGPGNALSGMVKRIHKEARIANVQDPASLEKAMGLLAPVASS